ncbi:hypothetical protein [Massilia soli]|uniref:DUF4148 domain-containing protein n=1 Tax=Massilia soli TaxID=2792854 RepID=A0ABS7SUM3_9BURK|nr:hypothetical protein [Massilia soli]MBZ2209651.1 hypothetical protein [Massilia soli]
MRFQSGLGALALLGAAVVTAASYAQTAPTMEGTPLAGQANASSDAATRDQPSPEIRAPARSVSTQAGDSRGAATGSSAPVSVRQAGKLRARDEVKAEAVAAVRDHRATLAMDLDLLDGK